MVHVLLSIVGVIIQNITVLVEPINILAITSIFVDRIVIATNEDEADLLNFNLSWKGYDYITSLKLSSIKNYNFALIKYIPFIKKVNIEKFAAKNTYVPAPFYHLYRNISLEALSIMCLNRTVLRFIMTMSMQRQKLLAKDKGALFYDENGYDITTISINLSKPTKPQNIYYFKNNKKVDRGLTFLINKLIKEFVDDADGAKYLIYYAIHALSALSCIEVEYAEGDVTYKGEFKIRYEPSNDRDELREFKEIFPKILPGRTENDLLYTLDDIINSDITLNNIYKLKSRYTFMACTRFLSNLSFIVNTPRVALIDSIVYQYCDLYQTTKSIKYNNYCGANARMFAYLYIHS